MSRRTERVGELLRRELAMLLISGEINDPRLAHSASVSITAVHVSGDLSVARVFVDVLSGTDQPKEIRTTLKALRSVNGILRRKIGQRTELRRVPELRFEHDESIGRGADMSALLDELSAERTARESSDE
jgi:ribosome-binding factor A